jgi:hypothetical protein
MGIAADPELLMERRKIVASLDDHDYDQLALLAKINKIKMPELVRRIVRAYLDRSKVNLREENREQRM